MTAIEDRQRASSAAQSSDLAAAVAPPEPAPSVGTPGHPEGPATAADGRDGRASDRLPLRPQIHTPTAAALRSPGGTTTPLTRPAAPTATPTRDADYNDAIAAHRTAMLAAAGAGDPVSHQSLAADVVGGLLSLPTQLQLSQARTLEAAAESLFAWNIDVVRAGGIAAGFAALLVPLSAVLLALAKVFAIVAVIVDAPFAGLRALLRLTDGEAPCDRGSATHLRVPPTRWPELPDNAATLAQVRSYVAAGTHEHRYDVIVVPGFATDDARAPLHSAARARLEQAARDLEAGLAPFILVSGGNVHPPETRFNEAYEMRRYLVEACGVPTDRILLEPHAEHSTTNLRNAGRMMRALGLRRAVITTSPEPFDQSFYFQNADAPFYGFHSRSVRELGARVGALERVDRWHTAFEPSDDVDLVTVDQGALPTTDP